MKKTVKKYGLGSTGVGGSYIVNPATTMAENQITIAKADAEANANKLIPLSMIGANLLAMGASGDFNNMFNEEKEGIAALGNDGSTPVAEVEGKEVIETPDGQMSKVKGPSHEQGGVNVNLPEGTKIYSKRVEKFGQSMAERKEIREKKKANLQKLLDDNKDDIAIRNAHSRTLSALEQQEQEDLQLQGVYGMMAAIHEFAYGTNEDGTQKYFTGTSKQGTAPFRPPLNEGDEWKIPFAEQIINTPTIDTKPFVEPTRVLAGMEVNYQANKTEEDTTNNEKNTTGHIGDAIGLIGDYYSATEPMKNTLENRATDTPNVNAFANFGKDALDANLSAMEFAASNKASSIKRIMSQANGSKRAGRNSARGVNTQRALDLATDLGANDAQQSANDSFVNTMTQLFGYKSQLENQQDSAVMTGEQTRDLGDRQDKDNFYTQMSKDIATKGEGIQQIGKDVNDIGENNMMMNVMNNLSKYGLGFDKDGNIIQLNQAKDIIDKTTTETKVTK